MIGQQLPNQYNDSINIIHGFNQSIKNLKMLIYLGFKTIFYQLSQFLSCEWKDYKKQIVILLACMFTVKGGKISF